MRYIQLVHDKMLGLASEDEVMPLNIEKIGAINADFLLTFRKIPREYNVEFERNVHACKRFIHKYEGDVACYALENDSPIAPIILWDIVHTMPVGCKIYMLGEIGRTFYLEKDYFKGSMQIIKRDKGVVVFEKSRKLPVEQDVGMDKWTFGIPVGPDDATLLNSIVERIMSFEGIEKEIILCGRPGENFAYKENVRIVGEDISAPPIQISKKKNLIIREAKYNNLCILHDRVMLPTDFILQMNRYGDYYSFTTLQSVYFDDYHNFVPIRYSDYHSIYAENGVRNVLGTFKNINEDASNYVETLFSSIEKQEFVYASPLNYSYRTYPTGSLYILKRTVGRKYMMNENLAWEQFEDVEYGIRMNEKGAISRVNPYTFSQSMVSRSSLLGQYSNTYIDASNIYRYWKNRRHLRRLKYKPLFKISEERAWDSFDKFRQKYCNDVFLQRGKITTDVRMDIINRLIMNADFIRSRDKVSCFVRDVSMLLFMNKLSYGDEEFYKELIFNHPDEGRYKLGLCAMYITQILLRQHGKLFYYTMNDYYIKKNLCTKVGSYFSALCMNRMQGKLFYNPDGINGFYNAIINSSPWMREN